MEQQDYLKKQIDQLGQVLQKMFSDLIGKKNNGQLSSGIELTSQHLKNALDLDLQSLLDIPTEDFVNTLMVHENMTNSNLEKIAEILLFIADNDEKDNKKLYEKVGVIFKHLEKTENIYSLERTWTMERISKILS
jgi:predicted HAD superfamily phosphohydrolase